MTTRRKLVFLLIQIAIVAGCSESHEPKAGVNNEMVMSSGMSISATTQEGAITISRGDGFNRTYAWDGATRSVKLWPRWERWYGSLGAYYPGLGNHWRNNHGITRGVLNEGRQHFQTAEEAFKWIDLPEHAGCVSRDDGLMVFWKRTVERKQLNVDVWPIYIDNKKPVLLQGSHNSKIVVCYGKSE